MIKIVRLAISSGILIVTSAVSANAFAGQSATGAIGHSTAPAIISHSAQVEAIITTIAGAGGTGYSGDGGPASSAKLSGPRGVTIDGQGNLYISDTENNVIRKVDVNGIISTVAGTGESEYSGDHIPAVKAHLRWPSAVVVDKAGNLYIADTDHSRIRKVDGKGIITTVAGNGIEGQTGDGGLAINATLSAPYDIAVDNEGNLYIADFNNNRIRKVDTRGIISNVAGDGNFGGSGNNGPATAAELDHPSTVSLDGRGNIYLADDNNVIHKIASTGSITTVAGNGKRKYSGDNKLATQASLVGQGEVAVGTNGDLYIADVGNHRIRKVSATSGIMTTVAGNGKPGYSGDGLPASKAQINEPTGVAIDVNGNLYIADTRNNRIRKVIQPKDSAQ